MNILLKNPMRQGNEKTERIKKTAGLILLFISVWILTKAAISRNTYTPYVPKEPPAILLYGEVPGVEAFYEKEYELWEEHYSAGRPGKMKKAAWPGSCRMPMAMSSVMKQSNPW
jgi:hypothetical protein